MQQAKSMKRRKSIKDIFSFFDSSDKKKHRLVLKNGQPTIKLKGTPSARQLCFPNFFISVVELSTVFIALLLLSAFMLSWLVFAVAYFITAEVHGDFKNAHLEEPSDPVCIQNGQDFHSILLFSMETQTTIGYGSRYVTEECGVAILLVVLQSIFGCLIQSVLTGIFLFKFQQPKKRAHTVLFSKSACVYEQGGNYYIEIQILNMQRSQIIDPKVHGICVMNKEDGTGKFRFDMDFSPCQRTSRLLFRPRVYTHQLDSSSPFWDFNKADFETGQYEIILMMEGADEWTDSFVQTRTSYLPHELEWGRHFKTMTASKKGRMFKLKYSDFTKTHVQDDMPVFSAYTRKVSDISGLDPSHLSVDSNDNIFTRNSSISGSFKIGSGEGQVTSDDSQLTVVSCHAIPSTIMEERVPDT